jgi:acyl-CoA thioesterase FadM
MVRAGVPQAVAISISGHKTASMFYRYNITSDEDRRDALRRLQTHVLMQPTTRSVVQMTGTTES